jgi:hypothetical protein
MTPTLRITSSTLLLALTLAGCGDSGNTSSVSNPTTTTDGTTTAEPTTTTDATTSDTAPTTTTDDPTTTTDATTTNAVDPCDACGANAVCVDEKCECDDGYDGDGVTCTDIDECAGDNECSVDASCTNTPGDYDCTCNVGYKGNGETCTDVDECNEDIDTCSVNANCTNQDGGFKCECKQGYTGNGMICNGSKEFGDPCEIGEDCASGLCLTDGDGMCTISCTQDVANDCGDQGVSGLCIEAAVDTFVCAGDLTFGADKGDDEVMGPGDKLTRMFQTASDADVFLAKIPVAGDYAIFATPDPDDNLQVEFYGADASLLATSNDGGVGELDGAVLTAQASSVTFVVVRNIGNSNGSYTIEIVQQ